MKAVIGIVSLCFVALAVYFFVLRPSPEEHLIASLQDALGPEANIALEACDLSISIDTLGADNSPVALTRSIIRTDMQLYDFKTVRFFQRAENTTLRIGRKRATNRMMDQVDHILGLLDDEKTRVLPDTDGIRDILNDKDGSFFLRVMAEVKTTDTETNLIAHADAPDFFEFTQAVAALPAPISYASITSYAPGGPSGDTLLTGMVTAVPFMEFTLKSQELGKELAQAFFGHADASRCLI